MYVEFEMKGEVLLILEALAILGAVFFFFALSRIPPRKNASKSKKDHRR